MLTGMSMNIRSLDDQILPAKKMVRAKGSQEGGGFMFPPTAIPIVSMEGIFSYIYHKNQPNVGMIYISYMDPMDEVHFFFWRGVAEGYSSKS